MAVRVDLNTKVIAPDRRIWIVHSGKDKVFWNDFLEHDCVFLGYPGLQLDAGSLQNDAALRQRIRQSRAIRAEKGITRTDGTTIQVSQFSGDPGDDVTVPLRTVKHLADRIGDGDLLVVPGRGSQGGVLFGEATGPFDPQARLRATAFPYADVPVRRVRWLETDYLKLDLPPRLVRYFEKPPAIAEVARSPLTEGFYDFAYEAYATDRSAWASIRAPAYDSDFLALRDPQDLVALGLALFTALELDANLTGLTAQQIIERFYDPTLLEKAQFKFASPGRINLKDRGSRAALFVNLFVSLAVAGALTACSAQGAAVENSLTPNDPNVAIMESMINKAANVTGGAVLTEADAKGAKAKAKLQLTAPARVK